MALSTFFTELPQHQSFRVELLDSTSVGAARRASGLMASLAGLDESQCGRLGLIVTEAANNAIRYAQQGEIILRRSEHALSVLVLDKGPGMSNVERCMQDGFSTGGTRGAGLSSLARQADTFAIYSSPGLGTAIFARVGLADSGADVGAVCLPISGESECGDGWTVCTTESGDSRIVMADGLGHGPKAAEASEAILTQTPRSLGKAPDVALGRMHLAATSTRGAAAAVVDIHYRDRSLTFTGVGNIGGSVVTLESSHSLTSHNGIVGSRMPRTQTFTYSWEKDAALVMYSDGLQSRWSLQTYPGLVRQNPNIIAGVLYRDFTRGRDDVTVVVLKERGYLICTSRF